MTSARRVASQSIHRLYWITVIKLITRALSSINQSILSLGIKESPQDQRPASLSSWLADSSGDKELLALNPFSTHRKMAPAVYCVKEYRRSSFPTIAFECDIVADGIRMVDPGGNSMARPHSQRMRWPPFLGSKFPSAVTAHMPKARFSESLCLKHTVRGPRLYVVAAKTLPRNICLRLGSWQYKASMVLA